MRVWNKVKTNKLLKELRGSSGKCRCKGIVQLTGTLHSNCVPSHQEYVQQQVVTFGVHTLWFQEQPDTATHKGNHKDGGNDGYTITPVVWGLVLWIPRRVRKCLGWLPVQGIGYGPQLHQIQQHRASSTINCHRFLFNLVCQLQLIFICEDKWMDNLSWHDPASGLGMQMDDS